MAPEECLRQKKHVAPGQKNRLIGGRAVGNFFPGNAPMVAIQIGDRLIENDQRLESGAAHRSQEIAHVIELDGFPGEAAAHIQRMNRLVFAQRIAQEDGRVQAAGNEDRKRVHSDKNMGTYWIEKVELW